MKNKYKCPTCNKRFETLRNTNQHISKTGCNYGKHVDIDFYFSEKQISELEISSYKYYRRKSNF